MTTDAVDRAARGAGALWGWALRETGARLPAAIAGLGATGRARLLPLDRAGEPGPATGARRSLFALWRHGGAPGGRTLAILHPDAVLRRRLVLPEAAAGDVVQAVRLRLDSLCPIPPAEAVFAASALGRAEAGGLEIELAIARRSDLDAAISAASARGGAWSVAADFTEHGPHLVLAEGRPSGRPSRWLMAALAIAGLAAAYTAVDARLAREIRTLETAREALLAEARALQRPAETAAAAQRLSAYPALSEALSALDAQARSAPDVNLEGVRINQRSGVLMLDSAGAVAFDIAEPQP
ncbi:MAG: hypothetical protein ACFE0P_03205 [Oceanicaulis sp.]